MKVSRFQWTGALLTLTLLATLAVAQDAAPSHPHRGGMFGAQMFGFFPRQLDLSDAQHAQIKQILAKEKPTVQPLMQQMAQSRQQLQQIELSGTFDEPQVRALATQQAQTMTELTVQRTRIHSELMQVLTPDQKAKMVELAQERQQKFMNRHQQAPAAEQQSN